MPALDHPNHNSPIQRPKMYLPLWLAGLLLLWLAHSAQAAIAVESNGNTCTVDTQCGPPYFVCSKDAGAVFGTCKHKPLFGMLGNEVLGLVLMTLLLAVSSLVAISGGVVVVPFGLYLLGLTSTQAVAMANAITVLTTGVKYAVSLRNKSAQSGWKTAIDYNAALTLLPLNVLFSVAGGIASSVFPGVLTLIIMVICILQAVYNGARNLLRLNKLEREKASSSQVEPTTTRLETETHMIAKSTGAKEAELGKIEIPSEGINEKVATATKAERNQESIPLVSDRAGSLPQPPKSDGESGVPESEKKTPSADIPADTEKEELIANQKAIEGNNFYLPKFLPMVALVLLSVLVSLLRPGKTPTSLVGIKKCSAGDFLVIAGFIILVALFPVYVYKIISKEQEHKEKIGWKKGKDEVYLSKGQFVFANVWSAISGLISTILGVGGGILLNPLMAILHYLPATASWTINVNALVGRFAAVIVHIIYGDLLYDYVLFFGVIVAITVFFSENVVNYYLLKKLKSQRPYAMIFLAVCTISLILNVLVGVDKWIADTNKGIDVWVFKPLC